MNNPIAPNAISPPITSAENEFFRLEFRSVKVVNQPLGELDFRCSHRRFRVAIDGVSPANLIGVMHGMAHQHIAVWPNQTRCSLFRITNLARAARWLLIIVALSRWYALAPPESQPSRYELAK
jgi:hypothetical protein